MGTENEQIIERTGVYYKLIKYSSCLKEKISVGKIHEWEWIKHGSMEI